jgi:hypothetical protein
MTRHDQYELQFFKVLEKDKTKRFFCRTKTVNIFSRLQVINYLDIFECNALIDEIQNAENELYFDDYFSADASGNDTIQIVPPNVIINEDFAIPLQHLKEILQEWILFCEA